MKNFFFACFPLWEKWLGERSEIETIEVIKVNNV